MMRATPSAQEHIQLLYEKKAKNDDNSDTLARTLEKDITTSFKGDHKYLFELLQNADDAAEAPITVCFEHQISEETGKAFLIFSHSAKHFDSKDVERICDNASRSDPLKSQNRTKIGYKGIGFKAVFSISDFVCIYSNSYQFRFDKQAFVPSKASDNMYPWPIIPIWTTDLDLPQDISKKLDRSRVNFIIQLLPGFNLEQEQAFFEDNPAIMLFLKHVQKIQFLSQNKSIEIELKTHNDLEQLLVNGKIHSEWLLSKVPIELNADIKDYLLSLSDQECPQRLKQAETIEISFATCLESGAKVRDLKDYPLYCYLPTQVRLGLPFLINADFLLNSDRSQIMDNRWNGFLLEQIAYQQFIWLANLTQNPKLRNQILKLISKDQLDHNRTCFLSFKKGFERGIQEISFIPPAFGEILLLAKNSIVDGFDYYKEMSLENPKIVSYDLDEATILVERLKVKSITPEGLCELVVEQANQRKTIDFQKSLLTYLHKTSKKNQKLLNLLEGTAFLLTNDYTLHSPNTVYFSIQEQDDFPTNLGICFVHPEIMINDHLNLKKRFLQTLKVKEGNLLEIIRDFTSKLLEQARHIFESQRTFKDDKFKKQIFSSTILLFQAFVQDLLENKDFPFLKENLFLLTENNRLLPTYLLYLNDDYEPEHYLSTIIKEDIFVSRQYLLERQPVNHIND